MAITHLRFGRIVASLITNAAAWQRDCLDDYMRDDGTRDIDRPMSVDALARFCGEIRQRLGWIEQEAGLPLEPSVEDWMTLEEPIRSMRMSDTSEPIRLYTETQVHRLVARVLERCDEIRDTPPGAAE